MKPKKKRKGCLLGVVSALLVVVLLFAFVPQVKSFVLKMRYPVQYEDEVKHWAEQYGVDENLIYAFIFTESGFKKEAESNAGARGLMQMTDETFEWIKSKIAPDEELDFDAMYIPSRSIQFGTYYLALSLEKYDGDVGTVAAAYHAGWGEVDHLLTEAEYSKDGVRLTDTPYRTLNHYMYKIEKSHKMYSELYGDET